MHTKSAVRRPLRATAYRGKKTIVSLSQHIKSLSLSFLPVQDSFHEYIVHDEVNKIGAGGVTGYIWAGISIGLPPVLMFGSDYLKDKVAGPCLRGEKRICLAITEPWGGSDVANLKTSAKLSEDGTHYIVNGMKKWISNGVYSDYFTVAVRTGGGNKSFKRKKRNN